jgi:hypothetical protein
MTVPTIGRIVHYRLRQTDADAIADRRVRSNGDFRGNRVAEGDVYPMMITRAHGETAESYVNGQVMLDGNDLHWATSVRVGTGPGTFSWPVRS